MLVFGPSALSTLIIFHYIQLTTAFFRLATSVLVTERAVSTATTVEMLHATLIKSASKGPRRITVSRTTAVIPQNAN